MTQAIEEPKAGFRARVVLTLVVLAVFVVTDERAFGLYDALGITIDWSIIRDRLLLVHSWQVLPPLIVAAIFFGPRHVPGALGLSPAKVSGLLVGVVGTLPMLIGYAVFGSFSPGDAPVDTFLKGALFPGIGEEIIYRAFLFGFLFRFAGWGFVPASLMGAVSFGVAHMWQGSSAGEVAGIVALTAVGAVWFAWLYAEWDNNLFVPISFHVLMNAWWGLFAIDDTALGSTMGNVFRFGTIGLSVVLTLIMLHRRGEGSRLKGRVWHQPL